MSEHGDKRRRRGFVRSDCCIRRGPSDAGGPPPGAHGCRPSIPPPGCIGACSARAPARSAALHEDAGPLRRPCRTLRTWASGDRPGRYRRRGAAHPGRCVRAPARLLVPSQDARPDGRRRGPPRRATHPPRPLRGVGKPLSRTQLAGFSARLSTPSARTSPESAGTAIPLTRSGATLRSCWSSVAHSADRFFLFRRECEASPARPRCARRDDRCRRGARVGAVAALPGQCLCQWQRNGHRPGQRHAAAHDELPVDVQRPVAPGRGHHADRDPRCRLDVCRLGRRLLGTSRRAPSIAPTVACRRPPFSTVPGRSSFR